MTDLITTPPGRFVQGNLYRGNDKDANGQPKFFKSGPNIGQPRTDFYFALAIPKGTETHWNQTPWGQVIESIGKLAFPQAWMRPDFSWKVTDGDSTAYNTATPPRRPCDFEGFPGNWILRFTRPFAPKIYNEDGSQLIMVDDYIKLGDYIQVCASVVPNESAQRPGLYLNHLMVSFQGYGPRITTGVDPKSVGFGQAPLPAGASATPIGNFTPPMEAPQPAVAAVAPQPYPQILNAAPPPLAPVRIMLAAANGLTYEQYKAANWTDEQMIAAGIMAP